MKVLIDADACPVVNEAIEIATTFEIETEIYCDTSHIIDILFPIWTSHNI